MCTRRPNPAAACGPSTSPSGINPGVAKASLRTASIYCLVVWAAVWCLFVLIRFTGFDIRVIPGIAPLMLVALVLSVIGPVVAIGLIGVALIQRPRAAVSWMILGGAVAACIAVGFIFAATKWL